MANINIRTDDKLKSDCEALFESLGLNMSTAVNMFLRQSIRISGIPFDVKADVPNETTLEAMREGERLLEDTSTKGYKSIDELRIALDV